GRLTREFSLSGTGKDIRRIYDDAGRLVEVNDLGTGVKTVYTYEIDGDRASEATTSTQHTEAHRTLAYAYDAVGRMTRWADAVTGMHTNYLWDAAGNLKQTYTDLGYDPDNEGLAAGERF